MILKTAYSLIPWKVLDELIHKTYVCFWENAQGEVVDAYLHIEDYTSLMSLDLQFLSSVG